MVDGSGGTPEAVPSPCCAGWRVTAEAARGPGAGAKGACTRGKLPSSAVVPGMKGLGLSLPSRSPGEGRGGQGHRGTWRHLACLPSLPTAPKKGASWGSLPILGLASLVAFRTDSCPLLLSPCCTSSLRTAPTQLQCPQDTSTFGLT